MMNSRRWLCAAVFTLLAGAGCKERTQTPAPVDGGTDAGTDAAAAACTTFPTEHEALLNAATDAAVVRKQVVLPALPSGDVPRPLPDPGTSDGGT